jgi:hypothetical protein
MQTKLSQILRTLADDKLIIDHPVEYFTVNLTSLDIREFVAYNCHDYRKHCELLWTNWEKDERAGIAPRFLGASGPTEQIASTRMASRPHRQGRAGE